MIAHSRKAAVAGTFYPGNPLQLQNMVEEFLEAGSPQGPAPKALIAPHAGFVYSGPIAASVFGTLVPARTTLTRVVMAGPSHYVPFHGLAVPTAGQFETPLGVVHVDPLAWEIADRFTQVRRMDEAHRREHCLETHLPFLQSVLDQFSIVPLVIGDATPGEVAEVMSYLWGGDETLISISSDLSHYHNYEEARRMDQATTECIRSLDAEHIGDDQACGCRAVQGLLMVARARGLTVRVLDVRNSGDTAGSKDQVVGYGAYAFDA